MRGDRVTKRLLSLLALSAVGCDSRPDQWDAFIYPDRTDLTKHKEIKGFRTFDLCQQAAIGELGSLPDPDNGDYECGYKCQPPADLSGINVCKETRK